MIFTTIKAGRCEELVVAKDMAVGRSRLGLLAGGVVLAGAFACSCTAISSSMIYMILPRFQGDNKLAV